MKTMHVLGAVAASIFVVLALRCEYEGTTAPAPPAGVTNLQAPNIASADIEYLAAAACDREERCFLSGPGGQEFASRADCMDHMRQVMTYDLRAYDCPKGAARKGLEHCASILSNEECNHSLDAPSRVGSCRTEALCAK